MVDQAAIQAHVNYGYSQAAKRLGVPFVQFRPANTGQVLVNDNIIQEINLAFDQDYNFSMIKPQEYNNNRYYALLDLTFVNIGDYFWDYNQTIFFVGWIEPLRPAELILCNHTITLYTPSGSIDNGYGGNVSPVTKLTNWPVSLLPGTKGESNESKTPGSIRAPWGEMLMPNLLGVSVDEYDLVITERDERYIVSQSSLAKEGYFCTMSRENA